MARQSRRTAQPKQSGAPAPEAQVSAGTGIEGGVPDRHLIIFWVADGSFGFRLDRVGEVVRVPRLAHMPLAPRSLLGIANLRGDVLPVVSLRRLLGLPDAPVTEAARVIVMAGGASVGFVVDEIHRLLAVPEDRLEHDHVGAGEVDPDLLEGIVKGSEGESTIKILDPQRLLHGEFARLSDSGPRAETRVSIPAAAAAPSPTESTQVALLSFDLGSQEYALPLERVLEIMSLPDQVSEIPRAETAVLGVVTLRDRLLPLVSLRALMGMPSNVQPEQRGKVVVLSMGSGAVGLVADRTREILRIDPHQVDPAPALLTRGEGDAEITSICRLDRGKRLVALLSPDRLFRSDVIRRVLADHGQATATPEAQTEGDVMTDEQFIIFWLGDQEFGIPVGAVEEIARPPEHITQLPKAPAFIDGVMNLRGAVVPVVDLRRRFQLAAKEPGSAPRILVLAIGGRKTGFMVDGVSEVMKVPAAAISSAPELSPEQMRMISRVANLEPQGRMILLVEAAPLLDRVEADILAKFDLSELGQAPMAS
jgi:purine-binding chemotaxis protein CheW